MQKGTKHTEETKKKMSEIRKRLFKEKKIIHTKGMLNKHHSIKTRKNISKNHKGKIFTEEHRKKLSKAKLRNPQRFWLGKHFSKKHRDKISGENNHSWKGDQVGYTALHLWIRRHKTKPELCEDCHKYPPYDVANISGEYKRDINDFEWLCRKCHIKKDNRLEKLMIGGKNYRKNLKEKKCCFCNKKFVPKNNNQIYCSGYCYRKNKNFKRVFVK